MHVLETLSNKSGFVEIEPLELTADRPNSIGYYEGDPVRIGVQHKQEVRGKGSHQEVRVFTSGPYQVEWKIHQDKVRVEEK